MKVVIELTVMQEKAIKAYLNMLTGKMPTKNEIKTEVYGMVDVAFQSGSLGDYYNDFTNTPNSL